MQSQGTEVTQGESKNEHRSTNGEGRDLDQSIKEIDAIIERQEEEATRLQDAKKGIETTRKEFEEMKSLMTKQTKVMVALQKKSQEHAELIAQTNEMVLWIYREMKEEKRSGKGGKLLNKGEMNRGIQAGMSQEVGSRIRGPTGGEATQDEGLFVLN